MAKNLSFAEFSEKSALSISYLNEIEKGKKYPKEDKIESIAQALGIPTSELLSEELSGGLSPVGELLRSNFLNDLPLNKFGVDLSKAIEIIANSPAKVGAFISTLVELSRNYSLQEESFYFGALRAYQELHYNYFEDVEQAVDEFIKKYNISTQKSFPSSVLRHILVKDFHYQIEEKMLDEFAELEDIRAAFSPKNNKLHLKSKLSEQQKNFIYGRELAFQFLGLKERPFASPIQEATSFDMVLNNFKANYFSIALLVNRTTLIQDVKDFCSKKTWQPELLLDIVKKYNVSAEMFFHRLTTIIPKYFDIRDLFFIQMLDKNGHLNIPRILHLNRHQHPHRIGKSETHCRRTVSAQVLKKVSATPLDQEVITDIQRARYIGTQDEYLCISLASAAHTKPNTHVSITMGIRITQGLTSKVRFVEDEKIPLREVHTTCERCPLTNCSERAAAPHFVLQKQQRQTVQKALKALIETD